MSRTTKMLAVGAVALGIAAAAASPALANRHQMSESARYQVSVAADNRHETVVPLENRHET